MLPPQPRQSELLHRIDFALNGGSIEARGPLGARVAWKAGGGDDLAQWTNWDGEIDPQRVHLIRRVWLR